MGGKGYTETDPANFDGSFYSATKSKVEEVSHWSDPLSRLPVDGDGPGGPKRTSQVSFAPLGHENIPQHADSASPDACVR